MRMACAWLAEMKVHQTGLRWRERKCASTCTCLAKLSKTPVMSAMAWWCLMYGHTLPWSVPERLTPLCSICRELLERQNASQLSRINLFFGNFLDFAAVAFHTLSRSAHRLLWFTSMAEFTSIFMYFPHSTSALYLGFPQCIAHLDAISHSRSNLWRVSAEVMFQMRALAAGCFSLVSCFACWPCSWSLYVGPFASLLLWAYLCCYRQPHLDASGASSLIACIGKFKTYSIFIHIYTKLLPGIRKRTNSLLDMHLHRCCNVEALVLLLMHQEAHKSTSCVSAWLFFFLFFPDIKL